jgi:hypothetical protein
MGSSPPRAKATASSLNVWLYVFLIGKLLFD